MLEHQVFVLVCQKNVDVVSRSFSVEKNGCGARKVGVEKRTYKEYQVTKQKLVFKNQELVFTNERKEAW